MERIAIKRRGRLQRAAEGCRVAQTHLNPIRQGILLHPAASRGGCSERTIFTINRFAGRLHLADSKGTVSLFLLLCGIRDCSSRMWEPHWYSFTAGAGGDDDTSGRWPLAIIPTMRSLPKPNKCINTLNSMHGPDLPAQDGSSLATVI